MRKDVLVWAFVIAAFAAGGRTLTLHLDQQDMSLRSYLSAAMLPLVADENGQVIRVNLHNGQVAMYEDGILWRTSTIAGQGNPYDETATPTGTFRILSKEPSHTSRLSGVIMPWAMRFHQGYYFHDIPYWPNGNEVRTRYSLGCIRLSREEAPLMYGWARVGTRVEINRYTLAKTAESDRVYQLTPDGARHPIDSELAFSTRGFRWSDIAVVPNAELQALALGATLY